MQQQNFFKQLNMKNSSTFGGTLLLGKRKTRRPLDSRRPLHLVLRLNTQKTGSLLKHATFVTVSLKKYAKKFSIVIYNEALVSNHIHLVLKFPHRLNYNAFIRAFSGALAKTLKIKWDLRPFSRVLCWGRDFKNAIGYVQQNFLEAIGVIPYQKRKKKRVRQT